MVGTRFSNPFKPGAGHMPPYLAGREKEKSEFGNLLTQDTILENLVLTGLRGVGKTVLLETFKPIAIEAGWVWLGNDLSESTSVSEYTIATRLLTDLSSVTSTLTTTTDNVKEIGFTGASKEVTRSLDFDALRQLWQETPGLSSDKLKAILETAWEYLRPLHKRGIIFAYDEAQNLSDHADRDEFPLSLLLDVFQSLQRKGLPLMLVMSGLPTLFPKLVEARTYAERMFHVVTLDRLDKADSHDAISKPIDDADCPVKFTDESIEAIYEATIGYPYFIQYMCRETYDVWLFQEESGESMTPVPIDSIILKLDSDFFAGRWSQATDRQRELLKVIAQLDTAAEEFTVQEIVEKTQATLERPFRSSNTSQMLASLCNSGLVYKNRWGKYSLAVPLLDRFIRRQLAM